MTYSNRELNNLMIDLHMFLVDGGSPRIVADLRHRLGNAIRQMEERIADLRSRSDQTEDDEQEIATCFFNMIYMQRQLRKLTEEAEE